MELRRGAAVVLGGLALILAALLFDASPLFVPGVAFTALGLAAPAWVYLAARSATVERRLDSSRVVEGDPVLATVELTRGNWGLPGAEVHDPLAGAAVAVGEPLSLIRGSRTAAVRVVAHFSRRGRKRLDPPSLIVKDPLELGRMTRVAQGPAQDLLVLPRTEPVRWTGRDSGARVDPAGARLLADPLAASEIDGLRPYRLGTPASRIHWPALARGAGLLERRLRADGDSQPLVVLDPRGGGDPEYLDAAVRAAASLVYELAGRGGCGVLLPGDRRPIDVDPELIAWPAVHVRLALVEGGSGPAPALGPGSRLGRIFYVAATPLRRLPQAIIRPDQSPGVLVLPTPLAGGMSLPPSFEVAGCRGFMVGAARAVRRRERVA